MSGTSSSFSKRRLWGLFSILLISMSPTTSTEITRSPLRDWDRPITLNISGGFQIGGTIVTNPSQPKETLSCDHGYMENFVPWTPRQTSLVMWYAFPSFQISKTVC